MSKVNDVVIVGAGFTGLTAAYRLSKLGHRVSIVESESKAGGLAGTFNFSDSVTIEKFYHHWFNNDLHVKELVQELGMENEMVTRPSRTGIYYNKRIWKLSSPLDLLRFRALSIVDRIRLGLLVFKVRRINDWHAIEHLSIRDWLEPLCGKDVYRVVWEPLVKAKFSSFSEDVNAVWMWKKLNLRGSTRNNKGDEELLYFRGGFGRLIEAIVSSIEKAGGKVSLNQKVEGIVADGNRLTCLKTKRGIVTGRHYLFTPAFPIISEIFRQTEHVNWLESLRRVRYLGNICLVLRLKDSLSDTYWLNVNDPGFPFVGVVEHTNFDSPDNYDGSHLVFLSRYLDRNDPVWFFDDKQYYQFAVKHLNRMFISMDSSWVIDYRVWRAEYAQPITERYYSSYLPGRETPYLNAHISTMAQIYPEDRGTNYAIREGRSIAKEISKKLLQERI